MFVTVILWYTFCIMLFILSFYSLAFCVYMFHCIRVYLFCILCKQKKILLLGGAYCYDTAPSL